MHATQILGITLGIAGALFALAGTSLERQIARHGLDSVTTRTPGARLLIASGGTVIIGMLLAVGASIAA